VRVLDLFAGLRGWSAPFEERGHEVFSVDLDERFDVSLHADIETLTVGGIPWRPDIILASPPCEAFSVMTIGRNWTVEHEPKTDKARLAVRLVEATRRLIDDLKPLYFVIENPRAKLRKLPVLNDLDRRTVTYCQYGEPFMKPTDLWGGFPPSFEARPMCKPRAVCHVSAARGPRTGIQGAGVAVQRSIIGHDDLTELEATYTGDPTKGTATPAKAIAGRRRPETRTKFRGGMIEDMIHLYSTDPRRLALSALRAMVPSQLALDVCHAAEWDLSHGGQAVAATLWQGMTFP